MKGKVSPLWFLFLLIPCAWFVCPRGKPHVVRVTGDNPKLQAAIDEAKQSLPMFIDIFNQHGPNYHFTVKAKFETPLGPEYIVVEVDGIRNGNFVGHLAQQPISLQTLKKGDPVTVPQSDVVDWQIFHGTAVQGGYTDKVLSQ